MLKNIRNAVCLLRGVEYRNTLKIQSIWAPIAVSYAALGRAFGTNLRGDARPASAVVLEVALEGVENCSFNPKILEIVSFLHIRTAISMRNWNGVVRTVTMMQTEAFHRFL